MFIQTISSTSWKYLAAGYVTPGVVYQHANVQPLRRRDPLRHVTRREVEDRALCLDARKIWKSEKDNN